MKQAFKIPTQRTGSRVLTAASAAALALLASSSSWLGTQAHSFPFQVEQFSLGIFEVAMAQDLTADQIIERYDAIMGPPKFESEAKMTANREDGTSRTYEMRFIKSEDDKFRIWFKKPSAVAGQEMLRVGDNAWLYMPNLKRATRIANRDSFQGGDFNNADVMRVNYKVDYTPALKPSEDPTLYKVELKAKNANTSYDQILLWVRKSDTMPAKAEFYGTSGKLLRSAEFSDYKEFGKGYKRPARVLMKNEIVKARSSEMVIESMNTAAEFPAQRFTQTDLGK